MRKNIYPPFENSSSSVLAVHSYCFRSAKLNWGLTILLFIMSLLQAEAAGKKARSFAFNKDIEATSFVNPLNGAIVSTASTFIPQALFTNVGLVTQNNVPVRYKIINASFTVVYDQTISISSITPSVGVTASFPSVNLPVAGTYTIQAISMLPLDQQTSNDGIMGTITVLAPLCGTYTIGAAQPAPFNTITGAITRLNTIGISCPVIFELSDALYFSAETFPITIQPISGASAVNTFTLRPKAGSVVAVTGNSSTSIFKLNGADYVTINGSNSGLSGSQSQDLSIVNFSASSSSGIISLHSLGAGAGASNNTIINTYLSGSSTLSSNGTLFGIFSGGAGLSISSNGADNDNNTFQHNTILKTQYGIYSSGESAANKNNSTLIAENILNAPAPNALNTGGVYCRFETSPAITSNKIRVIRHDGTSGQTGTAFAIALGVVPTGTTTVFTGADVSGALVESNTIDEVLQLSTTVNSSFGIVSNSVAAGNFYIRNNMINGVCSAATGNDFSAAIFYGGGSNGYIQNNTVSMNGNRNAATNASYAFAYGSGDPKVYVSNNIFQNTQTGSSTGKTYAIGTASTGFLNFQSGPNNLQVSGSGSFTGQTGGLGTAGTNRATLGNWQSATGESASSFNTAPVFVSSTDLHLTAANSAFNNTGLNNGVTLDIDNETRCITPDIGADEFSTAVYGASGPVSFCAGGSVTLSASGGSSYLWSTGATTSSLLVTTAGTYTLTVSEGVCTSNFTTTVTVTGSSTLQPGLQWQRSLGGTAYDEGHTVAPTSDGGYILAGVSESNDVQVTGNHGASDWWVVKTDATGNILWQKTLGGSGYEIPSTVIQTADGGYVVAGLTESNDGDVTGNHGSADAWIVKLNNAGALQWQKTLGGSGFENCTSLQQTADGGYICTGQNSVNDGDVTGNHGNSDVWVYKLSSTGTLQWQKSYGGTDAEVSSSIVTTVDGGYLIAASTFSNNGDVSGNHGAEDVWVIKINSTGTLLWQHTYGSSLLEIAEALQKTNDGGYILTSQSSGNNGDVSGQHGVMDIWVVKINATGTLLWQKCVGGSALDRPAGISQTADGGYIVGGYTLSNDGDISGNHGSYDYVFAKLSAAGLLLWTQCYGGSQAEQMFAFTTATDGQITAMGKSTSNDAQVSGNHGNHDYWMLHLSPAAISPISPVNICDGLPVTLTANPGGTYLWSNGATTQSIVVSASGTFSVTVNGCFTSDPVVVTFSSPPVATITPSGPVSFCDGGSVTLTASGGTSYEWSNGSTVSSITTSVAGTYTVTVSNGYCTTTASTVVTVTGSFSTAPSILRQKCLGGTGADEPEAMIKTTDGGLLLTGHTNSNDADVSGNHGLFDVWVTKTDAAGNLQWKKCLGGSAIDKANKVIQTMDGGYVIAGQTFSTNGDVSGGHGAGDVWVVKLSPTGTLLWQSCLGGSGSEDAQDLLERPDGTLYVLAQTNSDDGQVSGAHGSIDIWLMQLSSGGSLLWQKAYGGTSIETSDKLIDAGDGNLLIFGVTASNNGDVSGLHGFYDIWALKVNTAGTILWQKALGGTDREYVFDAIRTADGGTILTGLTASNNGDVSGNHGNEDTWVVKLGATGAIEWQHCYGGSAWDDGKAIRQTGDGGYLVSCLANSTDGDVGMNLGYADAWLIKIDAAGVLQWSKVMGGSTYGGDSGNDLLLNADGTITLLNSSASLDGDVVGCHGQSDFWLVQLSHAVITSSGPLSTCDGLPVTLTASPGSTYLWSTGANTQSIAINTSGTYSVTVDGCYTSDPVTVTFSTPPVAGILPAGPATVCVGSSLSLTATGGTSWLWSTGAVTSTIDITSGGTYTVTVSDGVCSASAQVVAVTGFPPDASFSGLTDQYCENDAAVTLTPVTAGGTFTGPGISGTTFDPSVAGAGTHRIVYTVSNGTCTATSDFYVDVLSTPDASFFPIGPSVCISSDPVPLLSPSQNGMYYGPGVMGFSFNPAMAGVGGPYTITHTTLPTPSGWNNPYGIDYAYYSGIYSSMKIVNGYPAIAFMQGNAGSESAAFVRALDAKGTMWGTPVIVDASPLSGQFIELQIVNGNPAVVYLSNTYGSVIKYIRANDPDGTSWGAPITVNNIMIAGDPNTCAFEVINSIPCIAYSYNTGLSPIPDPTSGLYFISATNVNGSAWYSPEHITVETTIQSIDLINNNGSPQIAFYETTAYPPIVKIVRKSGIAWLPPVSIANTAQTSITLKLINGKPSLLYTNTAHQLCYRQAADANGDIWSIPEVQIDVNSSTGRYYFDLSVVQGKPAVCYAFNPDVPISFGNHELHYKIANDINGVIWGADQLVAGFYLTGLIENNIPSLLEVNSKPAISYYSNELRSLNYIRYGVGSCGAMSSQTIMVDAEPDASFSGLLSEYCEDAAAVSLTPVTSGGTFSGTAISGNTFTPSTAGPGTFEITYTTVNGACSASSAQYVNILDQADATFNVLNSVYCTSAAPVTLTPTTPGGTFSGPGVSGTTFDPSTLSPGGPFLVTCTAPGSPSTWTTPSTIDNSPATGLQSSMRIAAGFPAIAYTEGSGGSHVLKFIRALDATGSTWASPLVIATIPGAGESIELEIVDGRPAIVYFGGINGTSLKYILANDAAGTMWGTPVELDVIPLTPAQRGICSFEIIQNKPAVAYGDGSQVKYVVSIDATGSLWEIPSTVTGGSIRAFKLIEISNKPALFELRQSGSSLPELHYLLADSPYGYYWYDQLICATEQNTFIDAMAIDGKAAVVFRALTQDLGLAIASDEYGFTWTQLQLDNFSGSGNLYDYSICSINNKPSVFWMKYTLNLSGNLNLELKYATATDPSGITWSIPQVISGTALFPVLGLTAPSLSAVNGTPAVAYYDHVTPALKYIRLEPGTCDGTSTQSVTISAPSTFTITNSGDNPFCSGTNLTLTAVAGSSYSWSTGETTQSIQVNSPGNYSVNVDDCSVSDILHLQSSWCEEQVNLKLFIEGFYIGGNMMTPVIDPVNLPTICDTISVSLVDSATLLPVMTVRDVIMTNGEGVFNFTGLLPMRQYYIVVKHRNSIETWSKHSMLFTDPTINYDFSSY